MNYAEKHIAHLLLHKTFIKFHIYENRNGVFRQKKTLARCNYIQFCVSSLF